MDSITAVSRLAAALSASVLLATSAGCAFQAGQARAQRLQSALDAHRYAQPLEEVWQEVRLMLAESGFPLASEDAAAIGRSEMNLAERLFSPARTTYRLSDDVALEQMGARGKSSGVSGLGLETGWGKGSPRHRRHVEAISDGEKVRVMITSIVEDPTDHRESSARDLEMELAFARRLDPASAERITAAAATR